MSVFTFLLLLGSYKLGSYNAKHPEKVSELCGRVWLWLNKYVRS